jgi:hypothetical protein
MIEIRKCLDKLLMKVSYTELFRKPAQQFSPDIRLRTDRLTLDRALYVRSCCLGFVKNAST